MKSSFLMLALASVFVIHSAFASETSQFSRIQFDSSDVKLSPRNLAQTHRVAHGHIPKAVQTMSDLGKLSETKELPITFSLNFNNEDELNERLADMYRPGSDTFHQFLTPEAFIARYAPTDAQLSAEKDFLASQGIAVESVSTNHLFLRAKVNVSTLNKVFNTELHQYIAQDGEIYFAPAYDLQVPVQSKISHVIGLSNIAKPEKQVQYPKKLAHNVAMKQEGSAPGGGIAPKDLLAAYQVPKGLSGQGETVALFEIDGYAPSDIQAYEKQFGLPAISLQNIYVDGATGVPSNAADEVTLDIQMIAAIAPGSRILVYEAPTADDTFASFGVALIDVMEKIASDNLAREVSISWGISENKLATADLAAEGKVFQQMAAQGQCVFAATGDNGATNGDSTLSALNPAAQPYVVAVGGTTLQIASNGAWKSEVTWSDGGGGVSSAWTIPSWQVGATTTDRQFSTKMRNLPDVSLVADPDTGLAIYMGGWQVIGGTSAATPLWAAFNALVNQERIAKRLSVTGFLSPALYSIGKSASYSAAFYDITSGQNGTGKLSFSAAKGYDNVTGWGSFKAAGLLQLLSQ